jgi:hypothetical protein
MAALAGYGGSVLIGAVTVAQLGTWSADIDADMLETTKFLDTWKGYIPGLKSGSGKFSGRWDMTDTTGQLALQNALLGGTSVALKFNTGANTYAGTAFIKAQSNKAAVNGLVEVDFSAQFSGAVTYT